MNVIVKQFTASDAIMAFCCEEGLGVEKPNMPPRTGCDGANDPVDAGIGAEAQRIEIARHLIALLGGGIIAECPIATGNAEMQFSVLVVDPGGVEIKLKRFRVGV